MIDLINWKVRAMNPAFWLALVPAVLLLIQVCAAPFGYQFDFTVLDQQLAAIINAVFGLLAILGVVVDHTTEGITDSLQALDYKHPKTLDEQAGIEDGKIGGTE